MIKSCATIDYYIYIYIIVDSSTIFDHEVYILNMVVTE